jgi:hypothetical protein
MENIMDSLPEEYKDDPGADPELVSYLTDALIAELEGRKIDGDVDWWYLITGKPSAPPED